MPEHEAKTSIPAEVVLPELTDFTKKSGVMLKGARLKEELTQVELAKKIGIPQAYISAMEHGSRPIGKHMALRFAKFFNTDCRLFL